MKTGLFYLLTFFISLSMNAQDLYKTAYLEKLDNSEKYLLEILKETPDSLLTFKPTEREMTFQRQLVHICENMIWLTNSYISNQNTELNTEVKTKENIQTLIKDSFAMCRNAVVEFNDKDYGAQVDFFAGPKTKLQILNLIQDHVTHHRGQVIVYLNLNGIKPPRYTGW